MWNIQDANPFEFEEMKVFKREPHNRSYTNEEDGGDKGTERSGHFRYSIEFTVVVFDVGKIAN